jgi:SAM-dependent methyltransferase
VLRSIRNIGRANRLFGGTAAVRFGLTALLDRRPVPARLRLLDIGTGLGDIPAAVRTWLGTRGIAVDWLGIERHPVVAHAASARGLRTVLADGLRLPLPDRSVDVTVASQVAHHLCPDGVGALAREATRVSRLGVVIADLRPSEPAAWGYRAASVVLGFDRATREDGVISIRRGFRAEGLTCLLADQGIEATVVKRPLARVVAYWRTDG